MNKQEFQKALTQAMNTTLEAPVYIASGFFNDAQNALLDELESLLDLQGVNYVSPRKEGVVNVNSPMRSVLMSEIFRQNVVSIDRSGKAYFLLDTSLGGYDLGTVWEFGYAVGSYLRDNKDTDGLIIYTPSDETEEMFKLIKKHLIEFYNSCNPERRKGEVELKDSDSTQEVSSQIMLYKDNVVRINETKSIMNYGFDPLNLNAVLKFNDQDIQKIFNASSILACIDNRPFQVSILLGLLYSLKKDFVTCSFKGYGSNIMISKSSKGHINLPGIHDDAKNPKVDIK